MVYDSAGGIGFARNVEQVSFPNVLLAAHRLCSYLPYFHVHSGLPFLMLYADQI